MKNRITLVSPGLKERQCLRQTFQVEVWEALEAFQVQMVDRCSSVEVRYPLEGDDWTLVEGRYPLEGDHWTLVEGRYPSVVGNHCPLVGDHDLWVELHILVSGDHWTLKMEVPS